MQQHGSSSSSSSRSRLVFRRRQMAHGADWGLRQGWVEEQTGGGLRPRGCRATPFIFIFSHFNSINSQDLRAGGASESRLPPGSLFTLLHLASKRLLAQGRRVSECARQAPERVGEEPRREAALMPPLTTAPRVLHLNCAGAGCCASHYRKRLCLCT